MNLTKRVEDNYILFLLIGIGSSNFLGHGSIVFLFLCIYFIFWFRPQNIRVNAEAAWCGLLSIACLPAIALFYGVTELLKAPIFWGVYVIGYCGYHCAKDKLVYIKRVIFSIFVGFSTNITLSFFYNLGKMEEGRRIVYNFWTKKPAAATLFGLLSSVVIGYSFYGLFYSKKKLNKILCGGVLLFSLILNLNTATRTPFFMLAIVYLVMLLLVLLNKKGIKGIKTFSWVIGVLGVILFTYSINLFGFRDFVIKSPLLVRMQDAGLRTSRTELVGLYIEQMPHYLWGGGHIYSSVGRMAHNYLQEFYDVYGLIPFGVLLIISCYILAHLFKLVFLRKKIAVDFLLISMYLSMFLQILLEPVFLGFPIMFWCLLLIEGMTGIYLRDRKSGAIE